MFKIGNIKIDNQVVLAPMAGVSNPAYMKICEEMGVSYAVTELISAEAIIRDNKKTFNMLKGLEKINVPVAVQLFGSKASVLAEAAKIVTEIYPNVFIDINMGCPVPKVALRSEAGSALLKSPDKVREIVTEVVKAVSVPVTVKIRSGWDSNSINAVSIAQICEKAGASAIAIHGRTRSAGYGGVVNLDIIRDVKNSVSIPVIGNGDIKSCYDALYMLNYTGCDAVMIGRALLGNPWLIRDCVAYLKGRTLNKKVTNIDVINMIRKHLNYLLELKDEKVSLLEMRSHASWYLKGLPHNREIRKQLVSVLNKEDFLACLDKYEEELKNEEC